MKTTVKARNLDLDPRTRARIADKLRRLDRLAHPDAEAAVELIANASHAADASHVAAVALIDDRGVVRSAAAASTPLAAIDAVLDKIERQIVKARERSRPPRGHPAAVLPQKPEPAIAGPRNVVKVKRVDMVPMFEEDAMSRMDELGHAFFVFLNAETDRICVVYRRTAGGYGLIEPLVGAFSQTGRGAGAGTTGRRPSRSGR